MTQVTAAIIQQDDKFLICQRQPYGSCANLWEFPGGKQEPGETLQACILRECREELAIEIEATSVFEAFLYQDTLFFTFFCAQIRAGIPQKIVHQALEWVTLRQLGNYNFCPADLSVIAKLHEKFDACTNSGNDI